MSGNSSHTLTRQAVPWLDVEVRKAAERTQRAEDQVELEKRSLASLDQDEAFRSGSGQWHLPSTERGGRRDGRLHVAVSYGSLWRCGNQGATAWLPSCSSETTMVDPGKSMGGVSRVFVVVLRMKMTRKSIKKNTHTSSELELHYDLVRRLLPMRRTDISERRNNGTAYMHTG